jgi:pyridoxine/pyridoxamine 5'-phosphate oxidase
MNKLTAKQVNFINDHEWVIFATASKTGVPRTAIVIPSRVTNHEIIISNVQMDKSANNIRENNQVFVSAYKDDTQIKISGIADYLDSGALFNKIKEFEKIRDVDVRGIIIVKISDVEQTEG